MKKFLFSLLTAAFGFTFASAQQMSYYPNMVGSPGQSFIMANDDTIQPGDISFNTGTVGSNVIWNFQGLDFDGLDTLNFLSPNAQEMIDFPNGNLVNESNLGRIVFDKDVANGLFLEGTNTNFSGIPLSLNYSPAQQNLPAVASLGSSAHTLSHVDEKIYLGLDTTILVTCHIVIDSIELKRESDYTVNIDATGELRLPLDTFAYCLRALSTERTLDSIFIYCPIGINAATCFGISAPIGWSLAPDLLIQFSGLASGSVTQDSSFTAAWYDPYTIAPICVVDFDYDSAYVDTNFYGVRFKGTNTPDIGFEEVDAISLNVFPNPANDVLMLQTNAVLTDATMLIYNMQGQQVKAISLNGGNAIDVSNLPNGMYMYQIITGNKLLNDGKFLVKR